MTAPAAADGPSPPRALRTGVVPMLPFASLDEWRDRVRAVDDQGHDVLLMADHLGMVAPFLPLVAAAAVSPRLRFGVQVLNNEFWNPVLLAREVATADLLTGGRLELGLGAGHAAVEFKAAGIAYEAPGERIARLTAAVPVIRTLVAGGTVDVDATYGLDEAMLGFAAAQPAMPVMIGGNGDRLLRLAAEQADIIGLTGHVRDGSHPHRSQPLHLGRACRPGRPRPPPRRRPVRRARAVGARAGGEPHRRSPPGRGRLRGRG